MIERDYIMRMIDLLAKVLARVIFLKKSLDFPKAADELASACRNLLGLDRDVIRIMDDDNLISLLSTDESMIGSKCYVLGMLLREEAGLSIVQGRLEEAVSLNVKALYLLTEAYIRADGEIVPTHPAAIDEVLTDLHGTPLPTKTLKHLILVFEKTGRFDKAEDLLFDLVDRDPDAIAAGLEFYQRLLQKDDGALERGNLPRSEIKEAIQELHERSAH